MAAANGRPVLTEKVTVIYKKVPIIMISEEARIMFSFFEKNKNGLPGPKKIPPPVGRDIVTKLGGEPNWTWDLKTVSRPKEGVKDTFEIRVFDPSQAASTGVKVENFDSLNEHPELILYEGWHNERASEMKKRF